MGKAKICPHCGAKMVEYRFTFNKNMMTFLARLYEAGGLARTDDLDLTYSQRTNSHKLRYWKFAEQYMGTEEARKKRGWWQITQAGIDFVTGRTRIQPKVIMYRNEVLRFEGDFVRVDEVDKDQKFYAHYAGQVREQLQQKTYGVEGGQTMLYGSNRHGE